MVIAAYNTDLQVVDLAEALGTWIEMPTAKGGGSPVVEQDYYIQGNSCISQATGATVGTGAGLAFDYGTPLPFGNKDCFFVWQVLLAGNGITPYQQGGMRFYAGDGSSSLYGWKTGGDDFGRNPYGGWFNAAVDPTHAIDYTIGTPAAGVYQWIAVQPNLRNAISKGNPHGVDAIRWGRGRSIVSGGSLGDGFANFLDLSLTNDLQANRWGLFQDQAGIYLSKGIIQIGAGHDVTADNSSAAFYDTNRNITFDNTPRTYRDFNKIEIRNTGTFCYWQNINVTPVSAGGSLSRGIFEVIDNPTGRYNGLLGFIAQGCSFTDMYEFYFQSNCFLYDTTFRRDGLIRQNSAIFDGCLFTNSPSAVALLSNDIDKITNCDFQSAGTGHAIELTEDHIQGGSYTLDTITFTDYAAVSGGTRNEAIYNNSGNLITLYIVGGDYPSIRNGTGANTILIQATTYTLTGIVSGSEVQIVTQDSLDDGTVNPDEDLYHVENTTIDDGTGRGTTKTTYSYNYTGDIPVYIYILKNQTAGGGDRWPATPGYKWLRISDTLTNENKSVPVSQERDPWYNNPA